MSETHYQDGTISIIDILKFIRSLAGWIIVAFLLAGIAVGLLGTTKILQRDRAKIYSLGIDFIFPSAAEGQYQDGSKFSANQLISLPVLKRVVNDNKLDEKYQVSADELLGMLSLSFDTQTAKNALENYQSELARLKSAKAPYDTVAAFSTKFEEQQEERGNSSRTITLSDVDALLPAIVAQKIIFDIPKIWSYIYTNKIGVSRSNLPMYQASLINIDEIKAFDYPVIVDLVEDGIGRLKSYKESIQEIKGSNSVQDQTTKLFLGDIDNQIDKLERFRLNELLSPLANLGLSRDSNVTPLLYEDKIQQLAFEKEKLLEVKSSLQGLILNNQGNVLPTEAGGETIQLSGDFLDKIVDLSSNKNEQDLITDLKNRLLDTELSIADNTQQTKKLVSRLEAMKKPKSFPTTTGLTRSDAEKIMAKAVPTAIDDLNKIWGAVHRIRLGSDEFANISGDTLYTTHLDRVEPRQLNPLASKSNILQLVACFILVFLLVILFGAIRQLMHPTKGSPA